MSNIYLRAPSTPRSDLSALGIGGTLAIATFALLPLLINIPKLWDPPTVEPPKSISEPTPDSIPIEEIPPEAPQPEIDKPIIEPPPVLMTIGMLESLLDPGNNGSGIRVDMGNSFVPTTEDIKIFLTEDLDKQPRVLVAVKPLYPYSLQKSKTSGYARVQFVIAPNGKVSRTRVTESSHRAFEQPAIDAVTKSKWQPGQKDGKAVHSLVSLEVNFRP